MKKELLEPKEELRDSVTEEQYDEMLNEEGEIKISGIRFDRSEILKELDPTAYECGYEDIRDAQSIFICPICSEEFDDYDDAKFCCQVEEEEEEEETEEEGNV
jgi:hypothetical protein